MKNKIVKFLQSPVSISLICIILTAVGFYFRIEKRAVSDFWADELFVIDAVQGSFWHLFKALPTLEFSSYLSGDYYLIFPFAKMFGSNKWGLAVPHIISTIFCYYFLFKVCSLHLKNIIGYGIAFAIVSFNSNLIFHSFEIRYYAVLQTFGLATYYYTYLLTYKNDQISLRQLYLMGLFFIFCILFHFYSLIIICANIAFFLTIHLNQKSLFPLFKRFFKYFGIIFCITGPILYVVLFKMKHLNPDIWDGSPFRFIPNPLNDIIGFLKGIFCNLIGYKKFYIFFIGLLISLVLPHRQQKQHFWFLFCIVVLPISILLLLDLKSGYWFIQRQFVWVMPLFAALLGWCWESIVNIALKNQE